MTDARKDTLDCLIVGAGPVGLFQALNLCRLGISGVRIIDKSSEPSKYSKALAVHARTLECMEVAGIVDEFLKRGSMVHELNSVTDGRTVTQNMRELHGITEYNFVLLLPQSQTEDILMNKLAEYGVKVERSVQMSSFVDNGENVEVEIRSEAGQLEKITCKYLVGCDGAHSSVRKGLKLPFEGVSYEETFLLCDAHLKWPIPLGLGVTSYSSKDKGNLLVIGPFNNGLYRLATTRTAGVTGEATVDEVKGRVRDIMGIEDFEIFDPSWLVAFNVNKRMVPRYRMGRVFLAGDAAHIHSPAGGQGMNTGLQDAFNLAFKMAACLKGEAGDGLLESYDVERRPIAKRVLNNTEVISKLAFGSAGFAFLKYLKTRFLQFILSLEYVQRSTRLFISGMSVTYTDSPAILPDARGVPNGILTGARVPNFGVISYITNTDAVKPSNFYGFLGQCGTTHVLLILLPGSAKLPPDVLDMLKTVEHEGKWLAKPMIIAEDSLLLENIPEAYGGYLWVTKDSNIFTTALAGQKVSQPLYFFVRPDGYVGCKGLIAKNEGVRVLSYLKEKVGLIIGA